MLKIRDGRPGLPNHFDPEMCDGLGMRIVSSLVREMGVTPACQSNIGAQFTICIPKADADETSVLGFRSAVGAPGAGSEPRAVDDLDRAAERPD